MSIKTRLVAHTIRGRSQFEESKAVALAEQGYTGFAIDVYGKDAIGSELEACREMMEALRSERAVLQQRHSTFSQSYSTPDT